MDKKKIIKYLFIVIFFLLGLFTFNKNSSQAASALPSTYNQLLTWAYNNSSSYFNFDAAQLINRYNPYSGRTMPGSGDGWLGSRCYCLGNVQSGYDGPGNNWRIGGVIDIDGAGDVTVYGYNKSTKRAVKRQVTNSDHKKKFNILGYFATHINAQSKVPGYRLTWDGAMQYFWHKYLASGILKQYNITSAYWPSFIREFDAKGWAQVSNYYIKNPKITVQTGKKIRLVFFYITDGQQRITMGITKDDTSITIQKKDAANTNSLVGGAEYDIRNSKGKSIKKSNVKITTATSGVNKGKFIITNKMLTETLKVGQTYTIEEIKAPNKYVPLTSELNKTRTITLKADSSKNLVNFYNWYGYTKIKLKKVDADTKKALKGAVFALYDKDDLDKNPNATPLQKKTTNANGEIIFNEVPVENTYVIREVTAPPGYQITFKDKVIKITRDMPEKDRTVEIGTITNKSSKAQIVVLKKDAETGKALAGASFRITDQKTGKTYSGTTGSDGTWTCSNLEVGNTYYVEEISAPSGYEISFTGKTVTLTKENNIVTVEALDKPKEKPPGDVKLLKVIKNTDNVPVEGLQFGIKFWEPDDERMKTKPTKPTKPSQSNYQYYVQPVYNYYNGSHGTCTIETYHAHLVRSGYWTTDWTRYNAAMAQYEKDMDLYRYLLEGYEYYIKSQTQYMATATSDENGIINLTGFRTDGSYTLYEIGSTNPYFEVEPLPKLIMTGFRDTTELVIENERTYVDIEGYVFIDGRDGKNNLRNDVMDSGEGVEGVRVMLKLNGAIVAEMASEGDGHYKFYGNRDNLKIRTDQLSNYTVEFEYNGLKYESIPNTTTGPGKGSKAKESTGDRNTFNDKFSRITSDTQISGGKSTNKNKNNDIINYKSVDNVSEVEFKSSNGAYSDEYYSDDIYHITSSTKNAGLDLSVTGKAGGYPYDPTNDSIVDINFGMYEREYPDVAIASDLEAAEVSLNGFSSIYKYGKRYSYIQDASAFEIGVKTSDAEYMQSLDRELYGSDVFYTRENPTDDKQMNVYMTYKVTLKNQSTNINVTVNEVVDYYSKELDADAGIIDIGTQCTELDRLDIGSNKQRYVLEGEEFAYQTGSKYGKTATNINGYNATYIQTEKQLAPGETFEFYVQFKLSRDSILDTINGEVPVSNVVELNTVSATKDGKAYTAVDLDSAVGNAVPEKMEETLEDDSDWSPRVYIKLTGETRKVAGIVFEDYTPEEFLEVGGYQNRLGDGKYGNEDSTISNMKIQLIDIDTGTVAKLYTSSTIDDAESSSDSEGKYLFEGMIPGNYVVVYTYGNGDSQYTAQQYKGTIYYSETEANARYVQFTSNIVGEGLWYKEGDINYSDALDDFGLGISENAIGYYNLSGFVQKSRQEVENVWGEGYSDDLQHLRHNTVVDPSLSIISFTPRMAILMDSEIDGEEDGKVHTLDIENVDFGLAERPRYKVQIDKVINRMQIKKADGSILKDFIPSSGQSVSNIKYLGSTDRQIKNSTVAKGFLELEIDTELLQGAQLLVEYGFNIKNRSELEYTSESYYQFGTPTATESPVKLSVANIIDYVDDELQYDSLGNMITNENIVKNNQGNGWRILDWDAEGGTWVISNVYDNVKAEKNDVILIGTGLSQTKLAPGETATIQLILNKQLSPTQDEMKYENIAEIVEVTKSWGREIYEQDTSNTYGEKLGNLDPTGDITVTITNTREPDYHYSEDIIIHPPTGADTNTIIIISVTTLGILIILVAGIVIWKKKSKK